MLCIANTINRDIKTFLDLCEHNYILRLQALRNLAQLRVSDQYDAEATTDYQVIMLCNCNFDLDLDVIKTTILYFQMILGMLLLILDGTFHTVNRTALRRLMTQPQFEVPAEWIPHMPLFTNAIDWAMDRLPAAAA